MKIALLGFGRIGRVHASHLAALDDVELLIFDDSAEVSSASVDATAVGSLDEALDRSDGVVVATPTALHTGHILAAADAGKPIFSEKPISLDISTTQEVLDHVEAAGVQLQVGFQRRFDPGFIEMRRAISTGELGDLYLVRTACHDRVPPHENYLATSGSIFKDMHTHDFDAIRWLTGRPITSVFARGSVLVDEMFAKHGDVDTCALTLTLEGGALAVVSGARADGLGYDHRTEVFGSADSLSAGLSSRTPLRSTDPDTPAPADPYVGFADRFDAAYRSEMIAFTQLVAGHGPNLCPGEAALSALQVAVAAERSLAEGRDVPVAT